MTVLQFFLSGLGIVLMAALVTGVLLEIYIKVKGNNNE